MVLVVGSLLRLYYYMCVVFRWCVFSFSSGWFFMRESIVRLGVVGVIRSVRVFLGCVGFFLVRAVCL